MSLWDDADPARQIYTDLSGHRWDPLHLRRCLVSASKGALWKHLAARRKAVEAMRDAGDDLEKLGAAELSLGLVEPALADWGKAVFGGRERELSQAAALRHLDDFLAWCEGKGGTPG